MTRAEAKQCALSLLIRFRLVCNYRGGWTVVAHHKSKVAYAYACVDENGYCLADWFSKKEAEFLIESLRSGRLELEPHLEWL